MTREDKNAALNALENCTRLVWDAMQVIPYSAARAAINALPVKYPFNPDWPPDEAIRETIRERDDALKEVERLKNESSAYLLGYDDGVKQMEAVENKAKWQEKEVERLTAKCERLIHELEISGIGWTKEDAE